MIIEQLPELFPELTRASLQNTGAQTSRIHKPTTMVSFGLPVPLSLHGRAHDMVARRSRANLGRESVVAAHRVQIAHWHTELAAAHEALHRASPHRDLLKTAELQAHLYEVLNEEALASWPRTGSGRFMTRRQQLHLNSHLPALAELLQVRALQKLIDAFGERLLGAVNPVTGRLHTSFLIAGASTGRFSARGPNLQQMPKRREAGYRKIFAAPKGQLVMALDYSQIELRAVAELISDWLGTDSILRQSFAAGLDAHTATAMSMTGKHRPQDVTEDERQLAKPCNFGLLYRMGDYSFYNYLRANFVPDITLERACEMKAQFFAGYPDLARWQDEYARHTREQGYTQTVAGRRWQWKWQAQDPEDVDEDAPFYADAISGFRGAYAINHPVQGSSAEVMQIALNRLDQALRDEPVQIIATVHDEAVLLVPEDFTSVKRIGAIAQQEMRNRRACGDHPYRRWLRRDPCLHSCQAHHQKRRHEVDAGSSDGRDGAPTCRCRGRRVSAVCMLQGVSCLNRPA